MDDGRPMDATEGGKEGKSGRWKRRGARGVYCGAFWQAGAVMPDGQPTELLVLVARPQTPADLFFAPFLRFFTNPIMVPMCEDMV